MQRYGDKCLLDKRTIMKSAHPRVWTKATPARTACTIAMMMMIGVFAYGMMSVSIVTPSSGRDTYCPRCNDPLLCSRRFLFIVATGRSGSTSVMSMINNIPGFFMSGENFNEASRLRYMVGTRTDAHSEQCRGRSRACTMEARRSILKVVQDWIWESNLPPPGPSTSTRVAGFKEIRWDEEDVRFIQQACPCSRFIISTRKDLAKQRASAMYAIQPDILDQRRLQVQRIVGLIPPSQRFGLAMEDISAESMNHLVEWLGETCRFTRIAHANFNSTYNSGEKVPCT